MLFARDASSGAAPKRVELPDEAVARKTLANGLTVLTKSTSPGDPASIYVVIRAGASLQQEYLGSGIAHLVEHMVFNGTSTRAAGTIEKEVKSYGGFINGSVSQDIVEYHITLPSEHLPKAVALLKDILLNAKFDTDELAKEKDVISKEIKLNDDDPQARLIRLMNESAYLQHPYRYQVIGYEDKFGALTRGDALKFYNSMYVPNRMVIAVTGGIDNEGTLELVAREFSDFREPDYSARYYGPAEPVQIDRRSRDEEMDINLSYLAIAFHSTSLLDEDLFAMDILAMILGLGDNSRLNTALFKKKGLVHNISCWNYTPRDPGLFVISAILDNKDLPEAERAVEEEMNRIKAEPVTDTELETAKRMVLSGYIFSLQTTDAQASRLATDYLFTGSYDFSRRYVAGIQSVTKDDLKRVANKYLRMGNLTTVRLVPVDSASVSAKTSVTEDIKRDTMKMETLANGIRIIVRENRRLPVVSVSVAMLGGLMAEEGSDNGISNLTADMLLKGTTSRKEDRIRGAIEASGGSISVFSGFNSFGVNLEILKADFDDGLSVLKDILTNSTFPQDELDRVRSLILAAIRDEDDDIFSVGINALKKELLSGTPYALRTLGTKETVASITREEMLNFYKTYCAASNMVIAVSGDIGMDEAIEKLKRTFGGISAKKVRIPSPGRPDIGTVKREFIEMKKEESLVLLGFIGAGVQDEDRYAVDVMTSVMSGQSGRMMEKLRNEKALAYTLGCFQRTALDTGFIGFYVATVKESMPDTRSALEREIEELRSNLVAEDEFESAKREIIAGRRINMQKNSFYTFNSAIDELYGMGHDNLYKYAERIRCVTREDIRRVAAKYLNRKAYAEIIVSPGK